MKTVLITGGNRGIGKGIVKYFIDNNWQVIFTYYQNKKKAEKTLKEFNNSCFIYKLNQRDPDNIDDLSKYLKKSFNKIDGIVNNAATLEQTDFFKITIPKWNEILEINLRGPFLIIQKLYPLLKKKTGSIVNISSIGGQIGGNLAVHYAASKAALISLTRSVARIAGKDEIRCNALAPGLVLTEMSSEELKSPVGKEKIKNTPLQRPGLISEIAQTVFWLISDKSSYITGQTINLNGGSFFT